MHSDYFNITIAIVCNECLKWVAIVSRHALQMRKELSTRYRRAQSRSSPLASLRGTKQSLLRKVRFVQLRDCFVPRNDGYSSISCFFFNSNIEKSLSDCLMILPSMPKPVTSNSTKSLGCSHWGW